MVTTGDYGSLIATKAITVIALDWCSTLCNRFHLETASNHLLTIWRIKFLPDGY